MTKDIFGPFDEGEEETFAVEAFIVDVQVAIQKALLAKGISQAELARRLGLSQARVSQIFSGSGANLTLKTLARISYALGEPIVSTNGKESSRGEKIYPPAGRGASLWALCALDEVAWEEKLGSANDNAHPVREIAA
jgi:transcriptional regulator with XRE-family HTH domain